MKLTLYCAMCGKEQEYEFDVEHSDASASVKNLIESLGWICQVNWPRVDIYCSARCSE